MESFFKDFKIHVIVFVLVIISELIGIKVFNFGSISFALLPMLYALILGIILSQIKFIDLIDEEDMTTSSSYIGIGVMILIAFTATDIGPNLNEVFKAGPALILQEFGNMGTALLGLPIAVLIFKMDRTAVGSSFSTARENSIAVVDDVWGLDGPEGRGIMGVYITGTLLGAILSGVLASIFINIPWFSPESLAMASGTGSASMMSAALAPILEAFPEKSESLAAFAATSQVLTHATGLYMTLFLTIPITEWLYKKLRGKKAIEEENRILEANKREREKIVADAIKEEYGEVIKENVWVTRIKVLIYSGSFSLIANWLGSLKRGDAITPLEALPGMLWLIGIVIFGNILKDAFDKINIKLPTILYVVLIGTIISIPAIIPTANAMNAALDKIGLLALTTPVLAYAGIAAGKDMGEFKKQGVKIIIVGIFVLSGSFIGSAIIANIVLKIMG